MESAASDVGYLKCRIFNAEPRELLENKSI